MEDNLMEMNLNNEVVNIVDDVVDNSNVEETIDAVVKTNKGNYKLKGIIIGSLIGIGGTLLYKKVIKPRLLAKKGVNSSEVKKDLSEDDNYDCDDNEKNNVIDINETDN